MKCRIAIDGPAGSGKTTIARALAKRLGIDYLDTGAMYRIVGLHLHHLGLQPSDSSIELYLSSLKLEYANGCFFLNGTPVGEEIRTPEAGMYASLFAANPSVRSFLTKLQKEICRERSIVAEGRDIGTVVIPDAEVKVFLTASLQIRAERRYQELKSMGKDVDFERILTEMKERDENDSRRSIAPLTKADDAVELDTSHLTIDEVVEKIVTIVRERCKV